MKITSLLFSCAFVATAALAHDTESKLLQDLPKIDAKVSSAEGKIPKRPELKHNDHVESEKDIALQQDSTSISLQSDWTRRANVNAALSKALAILASASGSSSSYWNGVYSEVYSDLRRSTVHFPPVGREFVYCSNNPGVLAYAYVGSPNMYLCASTLESGFYGDENPLAQIIVHEGGHVSGYGNECDATKIEVGAMRASGVGLQFKNGYYDRCGL